jgi:5-methylcytosine-specific restriction protein B
LLTEYFKEILDNYIESKNTGRFNKNHEMFKLINYTTTDALNGIAKAYGLKVKGSCGAGTWTRYPWIAIYNEKITTTIQRGVYIVYLFSEDMSRVYLTLNQGCTNLKKDLGTKGAREAMITTREMIRNALNYAQFNTDNDLIIGNVDYEIGSIYYKEYLRGSLPNEEEFVQDLKDMIKIYDDYYKLIYLKDYDVTPNHHEFITIIEDGEKSMKDNLHTIYNYIRAKGFIYTYGDLSNLYLSLKTKPFLILAGISGTGKSKIVRLFADAIGANYNLISVKPDWNDSTELFGYKNIYDEFVPGQLTRIIQEASKPQNLNKPYFVCLDEMNLARVEYYLSDYLSIIESRHFDSDNRLITDRIFRKDYLTEDNPYAGLSFPENLYIIGTVNMDDTTFAFSRKVLDRVNTIEFSDVRLDILDFGLEDDIDRINLQNSWFKTDYLTIKDAIRVDKEYVSKINKEIIEINNILAMGNKHFGYRVRDEIIFYMLENKKHKLLEEDVALDYQIMQKILPTITGSDRLIKDILIELYNYCNPSNHITDNIDYIKHAEEGLETALYINSANKILMMLRGYEDGFVSFWQ